MGRRSSGARTSSSSRGASSGGGFFSRSSAPAPRPQAAAPAPAQSGGGMMSGLAGSVMHGMASGVGWSMASRAVDAVVGPRTVEMVHRNESPAPVQQQQGCQLQQDQVNQCVQNASDLSYCQAYFEALKQCQQHTN